MILNQFLSSCYVLLLFSHFKKAFLHWECSSVTEHVASLYKDTGLKPSTTKMYIHFFCLFRKFNAQEDSHTVLAGLRVLFQEAPLQSVCVVTFTKGSKILSNNPESPVEFWNQVYGTILYYILPQVFSEFNYIHRKQQYWFLRICCNTRGTSIM